MSNSGTVTWDETWAAVSHLKRANYSETLTLQSGLNIGGLTVHSASAIAVDVAGHLKLSTDSGSSDFTNGSNSLRVTLSPVMPDTSYKPSVTPTFNPQTYGGLWVTAISASSFDIRLGSNADTALTALWVAFR